jgi:hypothetical protein
MQLKRLLAATPRKDRSFLAPGISVLTTTRTFRNESGAVVRFLSLVCFLILVVSGPTVARADSLSMMMFGHLVAVFKSGDFQEKLLVDGKTIFTDAYVSIAEIGYFNNVGVAIGSLSSGGNACEASYFVLSFPLNEKPRIDGPVGNCFPIRYSIRDGGIEFKADALPNKQGVEWRWTPAEGMSPVKEFSFKSKDSNGWTALRSRQISHPSDLLKYKDLSVIWNDLVGADRPQVIQMMSGPGAMEYKTDFVIGTACIPHACKSDETLILADIPNKQMFLAWKLEKTSAVTRPDINKWPDSAKLEFSRWIKRFR